MRRTWWIGIFILSACAHGNGPTPVEPASTAALEPSPDQIAEATASFVETGDGVHMLLKLRLASSGPYEVLILEPGHACGSELVELVIGPLEVGDNGVGYVEAYIPEDQLDEGLDSLEGRAIAVRPVGVRSTEIACGLVQTMPSADEMIATGVPR